MFEADRFYTAQEIWRVSHAPRQLVYSALASGELRAIRRGRRWLVPGGAVLSWIETREPAKESS